MVRSLRAWAEAIVALEPRAPLPERVVIVPTEAHAHALRVELAEISPHTLLGTRFLTLVAAGEAVLGSAGVDYTAGEELRRPLRVRKVLRERIALAHYRVEDLASAGWEEAFASTLEQIEAGALRPADLDALDDARAADLATVWRALERDAPMSWTADRVLVEAASRVAAAPGIWPFGGPTLGLVTAGTTAAEARLLRAIPDVTYAVAPGRPASAGLLRRLGAWFGAEVAAACIDSGVAPPALDSDSELRVLAASLFASPAQLAAPERTRSPGPDGTVSVETFAGVAEELDAAVRWVAREVYEHRTPLQDIAVLVPVADPLAALVADRLDELFRVAVPQRDDSFAHLAGGRPLASTLSGTRFLALVRALTAHLAVDELTWILPRLRLSTGPGHLSPRNAARAVELLGVVGGSATRPQDALAWRRRLPALRDDEVLAPITAALEALLELAALVLADEPLSTLWPALRGFARAHLLLPTAFADAIEALDSELRTLASDPLAAGLRGHAALVLVEARVTAARVQVGRFGMPRVFVGTIAQAAGLRFDAVRVLGLAEGVYPGTLRRDPLLPVTLERRLPVASVLLDGDYATSRLHLLARVVRDTRRRIALSIPRTELSGSEREPAALVVDVAAALARPNAVTGHAVPVIPTMDDVDRDLFGPARAASARTRGTTPLTRACWHDLVAAGAAEVPAAWDEEPVLAPDAIRLSIETLHDDLGPRAIPRGIPGLSSENPISAASMRTLLRCPRKFLYERVLVMRPRRAPNATHRIDPYPYGLLVHAIAEELLHRPGSDLADWRAAAAVVTGAAFNRYLETHALFGDGAIAGERARLERDIDAFITSECSLPHPRALIATELAFDGVPLATAVGPLHVHGRIDRIDGEGGRIVVRDLKTGTAHPRVRDEAEPDLELDLQLALYSEVAPLLSELLGPITDIAAEYTYVSGGGRSFRDDMPRLRLAGRRWIELAAALLRGQHYVATPNPDHCARCEFAVSCGDAAAVSRQRLQRASGTLQQLRELHQ